MTDPTELARVLAELEWQAAQLALAGEERRAALCAAAHGLLRDLAADFSEYADHGHTCKATLTPGFFAPNLCDCGYAESVAKWRLEP